MGEPGPFRRDFLELVRFGLVGVLNTVAALGIIFLLMACGVGVYTANVIGFCVGLTISFLLNRSWTFRGSGPLHARQIGTFILAVAIAYAANIASVFAWIESGLDPYIATILGMPVYTVLFYLLSKFVVFPTSVPVSEREDRRFDR